MEWLITLLFLGAGASSPFGIPTMSGFLKLFDQKVGESPLYQAIKTTFENECDLEVLMTVVEDMSKSPQEFFRAVSTDSFKFNEALTSLTNTLRSFMKAFTFSKCSPCNFGIEVLINTLF